LREAAADCHRPWAFPGEWSRREGLRDGARDGAAPAYWEPRLNSPALAQEEKHALRATFRARAGADLKVSDLAWEPVERAGPESECRGASSAARWDGRKHFL